MKRPRVIAVSVMILLAMVVLSNPGGVAHAAGPPSGIVEYVAITLTNSQSAPTPTNFQQQLTVDWSTYSSYLASNVQNVEFFTTQWSPLYAWCESSCSSSATSSVVWVNLGSNTIAASGGTLTIVMAFYSTLTNNYSPTGYWGAYPTFGTSPCTSYGSCDNGAYVFSSYFNFAGTAKPSGINVYTGVGTVAFDNGVTITGGTSATANENGIATVATFPSDTVVDYYGTQSTSPTNDNWGWNMVGFSSCLGSTGYNGCGYPSSTSSGSSYTLVDFEGSPGGSPVSSQGSPETSQSGTATLGTLTPPGSNVYPLSVWTQIYLPASYYTYQDYTTNTGYITGATNSASLPFEILVGNNEATYASGGMTVYWLRVRAYPPSGGMPSASFATPSSALATPVAYSNSGCTTSSTSFDMGQYVYGGFTVAGSGGTPWSFNVIDQAGGNVKTVSPISSSPYCDSAGYQIPSSNSAGTWTIEVLDTNGVNIGQVTFTVNNIVIPDLPSGVLFLLLPVVAFYMLARRRVKVGY